MSTRTLSLHVLFFFLLLRLIDSLDTLAPNDIMKDGDVLISQGRKFALGFFSPGNSTLRYVGIWYYGPPEQTVVWVANRENPVNDYSGVLAFDHDGNLVIRENNGSLPIWSTNISSMTFNNSTTAQLLDSGNLVLNHDLSKVVIWQSFDYPTDTFLPSMKLGLDRRTGLNRFLTSWKSENDPAPGSCSYRFEPTGYPQFFLCKDRAPYWRGRPIIEGETFMHNNFNYTITLVRNAMEVSLMYGISVISRYVVQESGSLKQFIWHEEEQQWTEYSSFPKQCDYYSKCGPNGYCGVNTAELLDCTCLPGFEPTSPSEWSLRDGSRGCKRRQGALMCRSGEGFVKVKRLKLPDTSTAHVDMSLSLKECEQECLRNCNCTAYSSANVSMGKHGCLKWHGDLVDASIYLYMGHELYVRVDAIDLAQYRKRSTVVKKAMVASILVSVLVLLLLGSLMYCLLLKRKRADRRGCNHPVTVTTSPTYFDELPGLKDLDGEGRRKTDLPFFDFGIVAAATSNFSYVNELGQGGFGSVYKGVMDNGTEIAVKRLSKNSGQGNEEFKNEVRLIAKLQHRNLVKILGCCIHEDEKLLIYDGYMAPEYAMQGQFSIKSDVYSYGVLLLEIIAGQKNSGCYHMNPFCNLIGHVWDLWKEGRCMEIVDKSMDKTYSEEMVSRCIQIGLLCVQRYASDRPTMSTVVFMLGNADVVLPSPKHPAFIDENDYNGDIQSTSNRTCSVNRVSITVFEAR